MYVLIDKALRVIWGWVAQGDGDVELPEFPFYLSDNLNCIYRGFKRN